jgi:hypothetical protein
VARFCRDVAQLVAEVIAEQFQPQTIADMTGYAYQPEYAGERSGAAGTAATHAHRCGQPKVAVRAITQQPMIPGMPGRHNRIRPCQQPPMMAAARPLAPQSPERAGV